MITTVFIDIDNTLLDFDAYIRQIRENQSGHGSAAPSPSGDR